MGKNEEVEAEEGEEAGKGLICKGKRRGRERGKEEKKGGDE